MGRANIEAMRKTHTDLPIVQTVTESAIKETWAPSLGRKCPLEKGIATLQYLCLENSMDRGAWWAMVLGVAKS